MIGRDRACSGYPTMPRHVGPTEVPDLYGKLGDAVLGKAMCGHVELNNPTSPYWETCAVLAACSNIVVSALLISAGVFAV
jgi:hypothetical protein